MSALSATRRTCILVDLDSYSKLDGQQQHDAQAALADALTSAARSAGLDRLDWRRQPSGDGELAVLPDGENQAHVVGAFPVALSEELRAIHNGSGLHLRLRMAVAYGVVTPAALGYSDHTVVDVARIADNPVVRKALTSAEHGYLVLALSAELFRDVIRSGGTVILPDRFRRIRVDRSTVDAWITVPGVDPDQLQTEPERPEPPPTPQTTTQTVAGSGTAVAAGNDIGAGAIGQGSTGYHTTFKESVVTRDLHIGPRNG
jgi:hypothetical protein